MLLRRFIAVLVAVAVLGVTKAWVLEASVKDSRNDAHLVNVAGRQRMLSQRIAKAAIACQFGSENSPSSLDRYRQQLRRSLDEFRDSHAAVRERSPEAGFSGSHSEVVLTRFDALQPILEGLVAAAESRLEGDDDPAEIAGLLSASDAYLRAMNAIVFDLAAESERRIAQAAMGVHCGAAATTLLMAVFGILVLKPAIMALRRRQAELLDSYRRLKEAKSTADDALRSHQSALAFTEAIVETAADAIIVIDEHGRITQANSVARTMFACEGEELLGEDISRFMPQSIAAGHGQLLSNAIQDDRQALLLQEARRVVARRTDGAEFPIELAVSRVAGIEATAFAAVIRDISQREAVERRLAQAEKLESVGSLAAGVAHEINTPLQFVATNLDFLQAQTKDALATLELVEEIARLDPDQLDGDALRRLDQAIAELRAPDFGAAIEDCVIGNRRITEIVRAMKEYTHMSDTPEIVDLNTIIQQAHVITRNRTKQSAEVELRLAESASFLGNRSAISQTIVNLIVNAADAIDEAMGGAELGRITLETSVASDWVAFTVRDNGCGMPRDVRDRAFDPFYTTKGVGVGSGQGLAIAYKAVVNQHGGTIDIDSTVGEGTSIRVVLPMTPDEPTAVRSQTEHLNA